MFFSNFPLFPKVVIPLPFMSFDFNQISRCVAAKGDEAPECDKFSKFYRSLCPGEWVYA